MLRLQHLPSGAPLTAVGSARSRNAVVASRIADRLPLTLLLHPVALAVAQAVVAAAGPGSIHAPSLPPAAHLRG